MNIKTGSKTTHNGDQPYHGAINQPSPASDCSDLFREQVLERGDDLMKEVWEGTPWMLDVFTGPGHPDPLRDRIMRWCRDKWGTPASPIHGIPGTWREGNATLFGWTWMGFKTEAMMSEFQKRWGQNAEGYSR